MFFDTFELKGVCHEIFELHLFQDSNPSVHLINRLKYFLIRFRFCRDILIFKKLHVCIIQYHGVRLQGVHHTTESDSAVFTTPRIHEHKVSKKLHSVHPRCAYRGVRFRGVHPSMGVNLQSVHHTVESVTCQLSFKIRNFTIVISSDA